MFTLGNARAKGCAQIFCVLKRPIVDTSQSYPRPNQFDLEDARGTAFFSRRHRRPYKQIKQPNLIGKCSYRMQGDSASLMFEGDGYKVARSKPPTIESVLSGVTGLPLLHL